MGSSVKSDSSMIKETLKSLCCNNGWCYGIFWSFDPANSLLLTLNDAFYGEQMGALVDNMLLQVHTLGGGVLGQAALTKGHRWMFSDCHRGIHDSLASFRNLENFQDDSEFYCQFSVGIKTIALISVEPWGVAQFGSTQKIPQNEDFVNQVKELFTGMRKGPKLDEISENEPSSLESLLFNPTTPFSSFLSCGVSGSFGQNFQQRSECEGFMESTHSLVFPSQSFQTNSAHQSTDSLFTPFSQVEDHILEAGNLFDMENLLPTSSQAQEFSKEILDPQNSTLLPDQIPSGLLTLDDLFQGSDFAGRLPKSCSMNGDFPWFSPMPCASNSSFTTLLNNDFPHATGLIPLSNFSEKKISENFPTNSVQSSITDVFGSNRKEYKHSNTSGLDKLFNGFEVKNGCQKQQGWSETLLPVSNSDDFNFSTGASECISEKYMGSKVGTSNSLFSKLGLDRLLDGSASSSCSIEKSRFEDQSFSAAKRRKVDNGSWIHDQVKILPNLDEKMKPMNPIYIPENGESSIKERGSCVGEIGVTSSSKRQEEHAKTGKKKAKPGTKPRPKDRQMIQDRLAELKELIPNGEKMSIDRLLERTIRHLNFMQSLSKHAENLKQIDKKKSAALQKDFSSNSGITWACEVGDQNMVCPLIVEDLTAPGQMLIEILCEEQGFFLEIVNIIRGFGLIILKGVMEVRETKIWGHFIVEAEGHGCVTRHEIFSSLIHLLQMTGQSSADANDCFGNAINSGASVFNSCQPAAPFSVNLADTLQCRTL